MLLTGTYERSLDEKLRVAIPKRLRDALGSSRELALFVGPGTDGSLVLYAEAEFARLALRLSDAAPEQEQVRAFRRLFYAQAEQVELDPQGRVRIPPRLAALANLTKEAVLLGVQDHLELWERSRWEAYFGQQAAHYDELASQALGHGR